MPRLLGDDITDHSPDLSDTYAQHLHLNHLNPEHVACAQECLRRVIKGVGGFSHAEWRAFQDEHTGSECRNFVDGDLIEQFLDLKRERMDKIAKVRPDPSLPRSCKAEGCLTALLWLVHLSVQLPFPLPLCAQEQILSYTSPLPSGIDLIAT